MDFDISLEHLVASQRRFRKAAVLGGEVRLIEVTHPGDGNVCFPVNEWEWIDVGNARFKMVLDDDSETIVAMHCPIECNIERHSHPQDEIALPIVGSISDPISGEKYTAHRPWHIPAGEIHECSFTPGLYLLIFRPKLRPLSGNPFLP